MKTSIFSTPALVAMISPVLGQGFGIMAVRSGSAIHYGQVNANGGTFWIGKPTSTYCPDSVVPDCSAFANSTAFVAGPGTGTLSLDVEVPGGQQVYVAPTGILSYTQPHSTFHPNGSVLTGFIKSEGPSFGHVSFTGGLVACPTTSVTTPQTGGPWQIYGELEGVKLPEGCLGFDATTWNVSDSYVPAWEYA